MRTLFLVFLLFYSINNLSAQIERLSLSKGVRRINKYALSFFDKNNSDLELLDSLYLKALDIYDGDFTEALLALTFSTLTFKRMPISLPLINLIVNVPLPFIENADFERKVELLPSSIFFDSPRTEYSDKDKLAHFFGNAFLSYNFNILNVTRFAGIFVEFFEDSFKVDGSFNLRDIRANLLGEFFGKALNNYTNLKPSTVFRLFNFGNHINIF